MLFNVLYAGVLAQVERVDAIVLGAFVAVVVNAAAGDDGHIAVFAHVKRVVDHVFQARLRDDNRNEHRLAFGARLDFDVNAGVIGFCLDVDIGRRRT